MLWEKRKFVVDVQYCVAVGLIPGELLARVLECEAQWREWDALGCGGEDDTLFAGDDGPEARREFLERNPGALLDTRHFDPGFVDDLLAAIEDIDEKTTGVAIGAENWQALNLLEERYREALSCVYIDPPYNSKTSEILYKNSYKHASWLSLMQDRLLLSPDARCSRRLAHSCDRRERTGGPGALAVPAFPGTRKSMCKRCPQQKGHPGQLFLLQS